MELIPTKKTFRHYMFFWGGQIFSLLGSIVVHFVITWYLTETTNSPTVLALAQVFFFVPLLIATPIAGVFSDRLNRKLMILVVDSLQAFTTFLLIIFMTLGFSGYWIFLIFIAIRSVFQGFHQPTVTAIIPTMVPKDKLSRINGVNFLAAGIVQLFAPAIAGMLLAFLRLYLPLEVAVQQALWVDIITFLIALGPLLVIKIPRVRTEEDLAEKESFIVEFKEGVHTLKLIPGMLLLVLLGMLLNFLIQPLSVLLPYYVYNTHQGTVLEYAFVSMGFQAGIIAGAVLATTKKHWKHKIDVTFGALAIVMIGYMTLAFAPTGGYAMMIASSIGMGFFLPLINTVFQTIMQTNVPHDKLGRVTSIDHTLSMLITPIAALITGPLAEILGVRLLFYMSAIGGLLVIVSIYMFSGLRHINFDQDLKLEIVKDKE